MIEIVDIRNFDKFILIETLMMTIKKKENYHADLQVAAQIGGQVKSKERMKKASAEIV